MDLIIQRSSVLCNIIHICCYGKELFFLFLSFFSIKLRKIVLRYKNLAHVIFFFFNLWTKDTSYMDF